MQPAADKLQEELKKYSYGELKYSVIANVTAQPYPDKASIIEYLTKQIIHPVRWQSSMDYVQKLGVDLAVELGPQMVLRNLMKKNAPNLITYSFDYEPDVQALKRQVNTSEQGVSKGMEVITQCIAISVCTKNSNWNDQEYQKGVVDPYRKIKKMKEEIEKESRQPSIDEVRQALDMLKSVFITKKTPKEVQVQRFNEIFEKSDIGQLFPSFEIPS